jgi:hypothetical protein
MSRRRKGFWGRKLQAIRAETVLPVKFSNLHEGLLRTKNKQEDFP